MDIVKISRTTNRLQLRQNIMTIVTIFAAGILAYFAYLLLFPQTPIKVFSTKILTPQVSIRSGTVMYDMSYCKYVTSTSNVYRQLVGAGADVQGYGFPSIEGVTKKGCRTQKIILLLPQGVTPGKYYIHGDIDYRVNAIRDVHTYYDTQAFEVTK